MIRTHTRARDRGFVTETPTLTRLGNQVNENPGEISRQGSIYF